MIAVIGMSARFPGARNIDELWRNLAAGRDVIGEVPAERWDHGLFYDPDPSALNKSISRWGGFIEDVDKFDSLFFNISPLEAEWMDPQQRVFLEQAYSAIEDAGYAGGQLQRQRCSVFVGCKEAEYISRLQGLELGAYSLSGSSMAILPSRLSYFLNLKGASMPVDTACSSSLVAVHLACESIRSGASDVAIAGGVSLLLTPRTHVVLGKASLLSAAGRCRTFADGADGIGLGEGVGVVVLKALERAQHDGDHIYGVIRGSGINQDGKTNGLTAPNGSSQTALELEVYERAGIRADSLSYVEAHGTGTKLGDPIEVHALADAFAAHGVRRGRCALGAAKTNLGHTLEASGMAALIKVLLCLRARTLVPSLHFDRPNRHIDFAATPFYVNTETGPWQPAQPGLPLRAAVSAFGFSGTNAHLVVEQAPELAPSAAEPRAEYLLLLSGRSAQALQQRAGRLAEWLQGAGAAVPLADVEHTLLTGRAHHAQRAALRVRDRSELIEALRGLGAPQPGASATARRDPALVALGDELLGKLRAGGASAEEQRRGSALLAGLYLRGYDLDWAAAPAHGARRVPLPAYPFERVRHWLAASEWSDRHTSIGVPDPMPLARPEFTGDLLSELRQLVVAMLRLPDGALGPDDDLIAFGLDSLIGVKLVRRIQERHAVELTPGDLLQLRTLRGVADRIAETEADGGGPSQAPQLPCLPQADRLPLSAGQLGLWLIQQLQPETTAYHVPCVFGIASSVDRARLGRALDELWRRHPLLRARVVVQDAEPRLAIDPPQHVRCPALEVPDAGAEVELLERLRREPFDLQRGPLARVQLVERTGPAPQLSLVLVAHHLIVDGSSVRVWASELSALYDADGAAGLPLPAAGYGDFVAWQAQRLEGEAGQRLRAYWRAQLTPPPEPLDLITDRPRAARASAATAVERCALSADCARSVVEFAVAQHIYPSSVYLAAWQALLHRYTGARDLLVAVPVIGRPHARLDEVVGYFVNLVCVRSKPRGDLSFADYTRTLQAEYSSALAHAELPFAELARQLPPLRVQFVHQNWVGPAARTAHGAGGLELTPRLDVQQHSEFELSLELVELGGRTQLFLKYAPELYDRESIARMLAHYCELLAAALARPELLLGELDFLASVERYQLHSEWRRTARAFPSERCIHELFEARAAREPDAIAVVAGSRTLTYGALDRRANQLAAALRAQGVGEGDVVGVLAERSLELPVGLFGILKAGAAYLPLDPSHPADRLAYMLEDSRARALLLGPSARAPSGFSGPSLQLDSERAYAGDGAALPALARPDSLAYVIYTSGSTGAPKGVMIEHRALVNRLHWMQRRYPLDRSDVILQKTPYTFDVSVWELFWWSIAGARMCLLAPGAERDPAQVAAAVAEHAVSVMHFVPSALGVFLDYAEHGAAASLRSLRRVFASGEALSPAHVARCNALLYQRHATELTNLYGPTEACIDVSYYDCWHDPQPERVPIGRPIDNIELLVLDDALRLQPIGVPGELCIAGVGLARGYLGNPQLTAASFVAHPLRAERVYRTGDRARWRSDGNIEYLGRLDRQLKIRGQRIELGENEAVLGAVPGVSAVCVRVWGDAADAQLIAYWVAADGGEDASQQLRERAQHKLPASMVPARFIQLAKLPQTAHGKVDLAALPPPQLTAAGPAEVPRPGLEAQIAEILAELTGRSAIGRLDNFFELGAHSLSLAQAALRLSVQLGREVPVLAMFEHTSVAALAARLGPQPERRQTLAGSVTRGLEQRRRLARLASVRAASES